MRISIRQSLMRASAIQPLRGWQSVHHPPPSIPRLRSLRSLSPGLWKIQPLRGCGAREVRCPQRTNVNIISFQPSLRMRSFRAKARLCEKNAFLGQVGKSLTINVLSSFPFSNGFLSCSRLCHSYRIGTAIPIGMTLPSLRDRSAILIRQALPFL